jgi:hypothetical protein
LKTRKVLAGLSVAAELRCRKLGSLLRGVLSSKAAAGSKREVTNVTEHTKIALQELKELFLNVKKDAETAWGKYKFLQIQIDMIDDRLDRLEHAIGTEIDIDTEFDLDSYEEDN